MTDPRGVAALAERLPLPEPTAEEVRAYRLDANDPENARLNYDEWEAHKRIVMTADLARVAAEAERINRQFEAELDGLYVHGVDMLRWNDDDRLTGFTVMVRPMRGLTKLVELMQRQLTGNTA